MKIPSLQRSPAWNVFIFCCGIAPLLGTSLFSAQSQSFPDCLYMSSPEAQFSPTAHSECKEDVLDLGKEKTVTDGEELLDIKSQEVRFIGCAAAPFVTFPPIGQRSVFKIYYPTGIQLSRDGYIAPLLHEIGHVFQLKQAGSVAALKASLDNPMARIELGADFIAGVEASRFGLEPRAFLINLQLVGSYNNGDPNWHGRPEDRVAAFRNGYFYDDKQSTVTDSYADFQDNRFAQIKHD